MTLNARGFEDRAATGRLLPATPQAAISALRPLAFLARCAGFLAMTGTSTSLRQRRSAWAGRTGERALPQPTRIGR
jgi:hypothetical protein